jgi:hypothetical protein
MTRVYDPYRTHRRKLRPRMATRPLDTIEHAGLMCVAFSAFAAVALTAVWVLG